MVITFFEWAGSILGLLGAFLLATHKPLLTIRLDRLSRRQHRDDRFRVWHSEIWIAFATSGIYGDQLVRIVSGRIVACLVRTAKKILFLTYW